MAQSTIPSEAFNPSGALKVPHHKGEQYVRDYGKGWRDSQRYARGHATPFQSGLGSHAYDDGYLDHGAGRDDQKWHLAWCAAHHNDDGGCGRA